MMISTQVCLRASRSSSQRQAAGMARMLATPSGFGVAASMTESVETVQSSLLGHAAARPESDLLSQSAAGPHSADPLNDLLLDPSNPRYFPNLPQGVQYQDPVAMTQAEIEQLVDSLRDELLGTASPILAKAASYFFQDDKREKIRPMLILLLAKALADSVALGKPTTVPLIPEPLSWQREDLPIVQRRLADVSEMFYTASLLHFSIIGGNNADTISDGRKNRSSLLHTIFGNKVIILVGDFILARAIITLARMHNHNVVETMSTILEHLVLGDIQIRGHRQPPMAEHSNRVEFYLRAIFYKHASLMALSCKSLALLGNYPESMVDLSYRFGKHAGMAVQLVDDVLDYQGLDSDQPTWTDLRSGLVTAPVLFAAQEFPELYALIDRKFSHDGDLALTVDLVGRSSGIERTSNLARLHAERAMDLMLQLQPSPGRDALITLALKTVAKTK